MKWESSALIANELRLKTLKNTGQYYQEETACHGNGIIAVLQSRKSGDWQDVASAEGWVTLNASCYQPWTAYRAQKGEILRWRLASGSGSWEVFSNTFEEITSSKEQLNFEAELKAKQEAEAKAAADKVAAELKAKKDAEAKATAAKAAAAKAAAAKAAAAKAAALKKTTITCVKGKLTKKVTAVKPVCPAGYKKK